MGCVKVLVVVFLVLMAEASMGGCTRPINKGRSGGGGDVGKDLEQLFSSQLPRGPVPPSGPSFCHNKYTQLSYENDYVSCP
ncbi:hypothetical protein V6N11_029095 [Hibiscus sabdariffa]|uniref:Uncharacterized protein n=2 Tax=Hibiscus sabdariffa TaxID=183260 RepID=A0ABR2C071_9ROSI